MKDNHLHIRIDRTLKNQIQLLAEQENRTVSNYIIDLLKREIKRSKEER